MSRLTSITLENFKGYSKSQKIPIKPLTLIFGPNSAGKSSIFHALAYLKECHTTGGNCNPENVELGWESVSLGGWQNLIHGHDSSKSMKLGVGFGNVEITWTFKYESPVDFTATICEILKDAEPSAMFFNREGANASWNGIVARNEPVYQRLFDCALDFLKSGKMRSSPVNNPNGFKIGETPDVRLADFDADSLKTQFDQYFCKDLGFRLDGFFPGMADYQDLHTGNRPWERYAQMNIREKVIAELEAGDLSSETLEEYFSMINFLAFQEGVFHGEETVSSSGEYWGFLSFSSIERYVHIGPLRQPPKRDLDERTLRGDKKLAAWKNLLDDEKIRVNVNKSLDSLDIKYEIVTRRKETRYYVPRSDLNSDPESCDSITCLAFRTLKKDGKNETYSHLDLGYGVSAILPILVAMESDSPIISMEQPEMHIHPRLQTRLGDLLIKKALGPRHYDDEPTVLVETHSEHLILRILRRIRETTEGEMDDWPDALREACKDGIKPDDVAVLYVQPSEDGCSVTRLRINELGEFIDEWPDGFFDERSKEIF